MSYSIQNLMPYLLVFARMGGMVGLNPMFARRNVPMRVRAAFILALTIVMVPIVGDAPEESDTLSLLVLLVLEVTVGAVCGFIFQFFYYMLFFAGDFMDLQFGLSMARVFDPSTNIQASISSNFINVLFMLYFFATNSHLILIQAFAATFRLVPLGTAQITNELSGFIISLFTSAFSLALRLALPFVAAEFVIEMAMGVLMKLIPQIHIFVINIQFKVLLGIFMLLAFSGPIANFLDYYMRVVLSSLERMITILAR